MFLNFDLLKIQKYYNSKLYKNRNNMYYNYYLDDKQLLNTSINSIINHINNNTVHKILNFSFPRNGLKSIHNLKSRSELISFLDILQKNNIILKYILTDKHNSNITVNDNYLSEYSFIKQMKENYFYDKPKPKDVDYILLDREEFLFERFAEYKEIIENDIKKYRIMLNIKNKMEFEKKVLKKDIDILLHNLIYKIKNRKFNNNYKIKNKLKYINNYTFINDSLFYGLREFYNTLSYDRLSITQWLKNESHNNENTLAITKFFKDINSICLKAEKEEQLLWTPEVKIFANLFLYWVDLFNADYISFKQKKKLANKISYLIIFMLSFNFIKKVNKYKNLLNKYILNFWRNFDKKLKYEKKISSLKKDFFNLLKIIYLFTFLLKYKYNNDILDFVMLSDKLYNKNKKLFFKKLLNYKLLNFYINILKNLNKSENKLIYKLNLNLIFLINKLMRYRMVYLNNNNKHRYFNLKNLKDNYIYYDLFGLKYNNKIVEYLMKSNSISIQVYPNPLIKRKIIKISSIINPVILPFKALLKLKNTYSYNNYLFILRTSKGLKTLEESIRHKIGGELLCLITYY